MSVQPGTHTTHQDQAEQPADRCARFAWCRHTGQHYVHLGHDYGLPVPPARIGSSRTTGEQWLEASYFADDNDGDVIISLRCGSEWVDCDADRLREIIAEVHAHLDTLSAMADRIERGRSGK